MCTTAAQVSFAVFLFQFSILNYLDVSLLALISHVKIAVAPSCTIVAEFHEDRKPLPNSVYIPESFIHVKAGFIVPTAKSDD